MITSEAADILPNVYNAGIGFTSIDNTLALSDIILYVSVVIEVMVICFGFLTNYALEVDTISSENLDYEELIKQAKYVTEQKNKKLYGNRKKQKEIDRSVSELTGNMNVDNQLGVDSNVGRVKDKSTGTVQVEALNPNIVISAPVANKLEETEPQPQPAQVQQPVQQAQPTQQTQAPVQQAPAAPNQTQN
jgi:hypothetical protein